MKKLVLIGLSILLLAGCGTTVRETGAQVSVEEAPVVETMLTKSQNIDLTNVRLVNDDLGSGVNRWYCQSIAVNSAPAAAQIRVYSDPGQVNLLAKGLTAYDGTFALVLGDDIPSLVYVSIQESGRLESDALPLNK